MDRDLTTKSAYSILGARRGETGYTSMPTGVRIDDNDALFAIGPNGLRHLLIPVLEGSPVIQDERGASILVLEHTLEDSGRKRKYIDIACVRPDLDDVFAMFIDDVLVALPNGKGATSTVTTVLSQWRELLAGSRAREITDQRLAGFLGELLTYVDLAHGCDEATLDAWVGPSGNLHDIVLPGRHLEVKTTTSMQNRQAIISGLQQLADVGDADLYLVSVRLVPDPDGEVSLRSLIVSASSVGVSNVEIYAKASSAGLDAASLASSASRSFRHIDTLVFAVNNLFPRLTEEMLAGPLPQGVSGVRYMIRLDGLASLASGLAGLCNSNQPQTASPVG